MNDKNEHDFFFQTKEKDLNVHTRWWADERNIVLQKETTKNRNLKSFTEVSVEGVCVNFQIKHI